MKRINLKLPENYIPAFRRVFKELEENSLNIIYLYSPPGYGKTTTLLKFFEEKKYNPVWIQFEESDKHIDVFEIGILEILSDFSSTLKETISLMESKNIPALFWKILKEESKNIFLPPNTYFVFLDTYHLMENFGKIIKDIILPIFKIIPAKCVIEANLPYEFEKEVKVIDENFFKLLPEEIIKIGEIFDEKISYEDAKILRERTDGWLLPCILFFKDKRDTKTKLKGLLEWPELLEGLLEENFKKLNEEDKISLLTLGQLREFSLGAIKWILGYENPERIINRLKEKGFVIIEEIKEGVLTYRFHRLLKSYLEKRLKKFPLGYDLFFRIQIYALDYFESIGDFENALYHAIKMRDPVKCGKYLRAIATDLFNEGKLSVVEDFLREIEKEEIIKTPELMLCEGIYLNLIEKYKDSVKILEKIIKDLKDEDYLEGKYFLIMGREYLNEKEDILIEEANKLLEEIKEYEEKYRFEPDFEKDPWKIVRRKTYKSSDYFASLMYSRVYNFLGNLYNSKREIEKAREFYEKSTDFSRKIKDDKRALVSLHNIGLTYLFYGDLKAIEYFKDIINFPVLIPVKANSFNALGIYYEIFEGDLEKAEECYKKALEINEFFNQREKIIANISNLASLYSKKGDEKKVFEYLEKLEKFVFETENKKIINSFYMGKTEILIHLDKIDEAKEVFKNINEIEILKYEEDKYYKFYVEGKLKYVMGETLNGKDLINKFLEWCFKNYSYYNKLDTLYYIYILYKKFNDPDLLKIRKLAEDLIREKGYLKRLRDFDIE
jgi:tetratricopeptide (TPR) repeat protein